MSNPVPTNPAKVARLAELLRKQGGRCGICKKPAKAEECNFDHIKPKSRGGANRLWNLQAAHVDCNFRKGNGIPSIGKTRQPGQPRVNVIERAVICLRQIAALPGIARVELRSKVALDYASCGKAIDFLYSQKLITARRDSGAPINSENGWYYWPTERGVELLKASDKKIADRGLSARPSFSGETAE